MIAFTSYMGVKAITVKKKKKIFITPHKVVQCHHGARVTEEIAVGDGVVGRVEEVGKLAGGG
ncbi:unnamed protein product [Staurois parvus]|uniref:Alcohol dehydrogenase N-terminal domain-containing protein n=1 Tax=Staurois parvus TaxID=386267 RepID=A0ABN9CPF2_9NEOB|nr:unnamed protein product [Staurois parvus]